LRKISVSFERVVSSILIVFFLIIYYYLVISTIFNTDKPTIKNGILNISSISFDKINCPYGKWKIIKSDKLNKFSNYKKINYELILTGLKKRSLSLDIENLNKNIDVYINGELKYSSFNPKIITCTFKIIPISSQLDTTSIVISGMPNDLKISDLNQYVKLGYKSNILEYLAINRFGLISSFGATIVFGLYFLLSFFIRRSDYNILALSVFNLLMGFNILLLGNPFILKFYPLIPFQFILKFKLFIYILATLSFLFFIDFTFKKDSIKKLKKVFVITSALLEFFVLIIPSSMMEDIKLFVFLYIIICSFFIFFIIIRAVLKRKKGSMILFDGFLVIILGVINDILVNLKIIDMYKVLPISLIFFMLFQAIYFAIKTNSRIKKTNRMVKTLNKINKKSVELSEASSKFVPIEFLHYLKKRSITDIKLGDYQKFNMTVLFVDIRDFTKLSEQLTPQENFDFLNNYLKVISPSISKNGGFIDKYIGDAIMALFPNQPEDAINAAIDIKSALVEYNIGRVKAGYDIIKIGAGIHKGDLILGTIGNERRMETTVIADAVNVSSRLEHATKFYGESILISNDVYNSISNLNEYVIREVDIVKLRGKSNKTTIYSILNNDDRFNSLYLKDYHDALEIFKGNDFEKALFQFKKLKKKNSFDKLVNIYHDRCRYADISGAPEDWGGFYDIV